MNNERLYCNGRLALVAGDITRLAVDAIVNAANPTLLGGGGVDGAIHRVAGPELLVECRALNGCSTGEAKITKGHRLPARYVIHTVGPVWSHETSHDAAELLARCYRSCFELAKKHDLRTIAFPSISTGAYGYPVEPAARIALAEIKTFLDEHADFERVYLVCFDPRVEKAYREAAAELFDPLRVARP